MATKNCPECSKQVPVACKKCGCGHVFFVTRRSGGSTSSLANRENANSVDDNGGDSMPTSPTEASTGTRRSGRVTRERPNFYDALQYENQTRRQKQLLRQSKQGKSEDAEENSDAEDIKPSTRTLNQDHKSPVGREKEGTKGANQEPKTKRRRGRPPGITGANRKPSQGQGYKITTGGTGGAGAGRNRRPSGSFGNNGADKSPDSPNSDAAHDAEDKALIATISAEKALQYNIVLQDINTKIGRVSWRGPME